MGSYLSTNKSDNKINPENSERQEQDKSEEKGMESERQEQDKSEESGMESVEQDKSEESGNKSERQEQDKSEENKSIEVEPINVTPQTDVISQKSKKRKNKKPQM